MSFLPIQPSGPLLGSVQAPPSKSITNRALLLAALARGRSRVRGALDAQDTRIMSGALQQLGCDLRWTGGNVRIAGGNGRFPATSAELELGNSGTAMRFLTAAVALGPGRYRLDGEPRMRQRPIQELAAALVALGVPVEFPERAGYPPLVVHGGARRGGTIRLPGHRSSQFGSALLMIGPYLDGGLDLRLQGSVVSSPYLDLTLAIMRRFGISVRRDGLDRFRIPEGEGYRGADLQVEGDASAAAHLLAAGAVTGGRVRVEGVPEDSLQPDARFAGLLSAMGCRVFRESANSITVEGSPCRGIETDLSGSPDLAPALAAVAVFAEGPTRIRGASHLRFKESDRIRDLAAGLRQLGGDVDEHEDGLTVHPSPLSGFRLDPCRDHRLAMAFATIGLRIPGVEILEPECVAKSFPGFFDAIDGLRPARPGDHGK